MGRYKKTDKTSTIDFLLGPTTYRYEVEDTETGEKGEGAGFTREEAKREAFKNLKKNK